MSYSDERAAEPPVQGAKLLRQVLDHFQSLESVGTERDTADNRKLLYNHYAGLVLLSLFNPAMQCVQGLADASKLKKIQKLLGSQRVSVGSLSESVRVFDPEHLRTIFERLLKGSTSAVDAGPRRKLPATIPHQLLERIRVVDGSALRALPQIVEAMSTDAAGKWRLHLQFEPLPGTPENLVIRPDDGGENDERVVLARQLVAGKVMVGDRGYEKYSLFNDIVDANSDYIIRGQAVRAFDVSESREIDDEARSARVIRDDIVRLSPKKSSDPLNHAVRRVVVFGRSQGRVRTDRPRAEEIVLFTSLTDVPAHVIAAIYELRWSIELFFRWLKHLLGCQRLISHKSEGIGIQVYVALIAALLLAEQAGGTVGKRAFNLICLYLQGWADDDELLAGLSTICSKAQKN